MGEVINPNGIQDVFGLQLALICGPVEGDPYTERQLARAWSVFKEELLQGHGSPASRGSRLWGYWRFELGIDPDATTRLERVLALAERGLLTEEERERVRVQAEVPATRPAPTPASRPPGRRLRAWTAHGRLRSRRRSRSPRR